MEDGKKTTDFWEEKHPTLGETEIELLRKYYPDLTKSQSELESVFQKKWSTIKRKAEREGLRRPRADTWSEEQLALLKKYVAKAEEGVSDPDKLKEELKDKLNAIARSRGLIKRTWDSILVQMGRMELKWSKQDSLEERFVTWIMEGPKPIGAVSDFLDQSTKGSIEFIDALRDRGFPIELNLQTREVSWQEDLIRDGSTELPKLTRKNFRALVLSDILFGHKRAQITLLHTLYELVDRGHKDPERGIDFSDIDVIFVLGNVLAGLDGKGENKVFLNDEDPFDEQVQYVIDHFPQLRRDVKTYILSGPTEIELNRRGKGEVRNALQMICRARPDLVYAGDLSHTFKITGTDAEIYAAHTAKRRMQSPYTRSLPLDRVEDSFNDLSLRRKGKAKPIVILLGGHHIPIYSPPVTESVEEHAIMVPSLCDPLASDRDREKQGTTPIIGFTIVNVAFDERRENIRVTHTQHTWTNHQIQDDWLSVPVYRVSSDKNLTETEKQILDLLCAKIDGERAGEISRLLNKPREKTVKLLVGLKGAGVSYSEDTNCYMLKREPKASFSCLPIDKFLSQVYVKTVRRVMYSDTHFGSLQEQPHVLKAIAKVIKRTGVREAYHCGDVLDGLLLYGPKHLLNLWRFLAQDQLERARKSLPKIKGVRTFAISGSHDQSFARSSGYDPIEDLARMRPDIIYLGQDRGIVVDEETGIAHMLLHPSGGNPKGKSYRPQEIVRMIAESIDLLRQDIQAIAIGHLHVALFIRWRGMDIFMVPCCQKQTEYLTKKTLFPRLGCWYMVQTVDENNDPTAIYMEYVAVDPKDYVPFSELVPADCDARLVLSPKKVKK